MFFWTCLLHLAKLTIMYSSLKDLFGKSVKVPGYVRSYLGQHTQRESFRGILSDVWLLLSGIPQGSVLGPLVLPMHTSSIRLLRS